MKKSLLALGAIGTMLLFTSGVYAINTEDDFPPPPPPNSRMERPEAGHLMDKKADFEKRLKLTDSQKAKAEKLREEGREKMEPVMNAVRAKKEEAAAVMKSKISAEERNKQIEQIKKDMALLHKKMHEIRVQNMKDFEAILTKKQKNELQKMKEEGRKNFEKRMKKCKCECKKCECEKEFFHMHSKSNEEK